MTFPIQMNDLGTLVAHLRREGFDARTDLFNGQVGLIVGPNGLDPKRMPPETAGLFFPLRELNSVPNRALVEARKFHEIFENRPPDWKFNRPYQRNVDQIRLDLHHWNRSAALLGDRTLEGDIQRVLVRRYPPNDFPVNIDVVGGQNQTYAMVQVTNFDAGIEEKAKAIPEDFIGAGGMRAAVLAAAEKLVTELQRTGRVAVVPDKPKVRLTAPLTIHAIAWVGDGPDATERTQVTQYEVRGGLPPGEQAWIANFGAPYRHDWQLLRARHGVQTDWTGHFESAESALAALEEEFR
jgi:hypothetical protein